MATNRQHGTISVAEYFELEKNNPQTCYEYVDGQVYMMAGGSFNHDTIKSNIQGTLWMLLRGHRCRVHSSDMKVRIAETRYFHPDVTVTCDAHDQGTGDVVQFPRLVVEVLFPPTEVYDRSRKLQCYVSCPTIEEYLLVDSRKYQIELYRKEQTKWVYYAFGPGDELELTSIGLHFPVAEAYIDVDLEEDSLEEEFL